MSEVYLVCSEEAFKVSHRQLVVFDVAHLVSLLHPRDVQFCIIAEILCTLILREVFDYLSKRVGIRVFTVVYIGVFENKPGELTPNVRTF